MYIWIRRFLENGNDTSIIFGTYVRNCERQTEREKKEMNFTFAPAPLGPLFLGTIAPAVPSSTLVISHTSVSMQICFLVGGLSSTDGDWCAKNMSGVWELTNGGGCGRGKMKKI